MLLARSRAKGTPCARVSAQRARASCTRASRGRLGHTGRAAEAVAPVATRSASSGGDTTWKSAPVTPSAMTGQSRSDGCHRDPAPFRARLLDGRPAADALADRGGGRLDDGLDLLHGGTARRDALADEFRRVRGGQRARAEPGAGRLHRARAPGPAGSCASQPGQVVADQVPAAVERDKPVRLDVPLVSAHRSPRRSRSGCARRHGRRVRCWRGHRD